jgi:hypothetical protein
MPYLPEHLQNPLTLSGALPTVTAIQTGGSRPTNWRDGFSRLRIKGTVEMTDLPIKSAAELQALRKQAAVECDGCAK